MAKKFAEVSSKRTLEYVAAEWPAAACVHALTTTRNGGCSEGAYSSFNLASHVDDESSAVTGNRQLLMDVFELPAEPVWLEQTHSNRVIVADHHGSVEADASWTSKKNVVCAVLTADCLPVFFTNKEGNKVAAAHAGWRGLLNGVLSATFNSLQIKPEDCLVWLGPAIGPAVFEVGAEVVKSFTDKDKFTYKAFIKRDEDHYLCDIYDLARVELEQLGIRQISGGDLCTYSDKARFYSYRRDGITGRMASLIWIGD